MGVPGVVDLVFLLALAEEAPAVAAPVQAGNIWPSMLQLDSFNSAPSELKLNYTEELAPAPQLEEDD